MPRKVGTIAILVLLVASLIAAFVLPRVRRRAGRFVLALVGYLWLAVMFYLLVILLVLEIPRWSHSAGSPDPGHALAPTQDTGPTRPPQQRQSAGRRRPVAHAAGTAAGRQVPIRGSAAAQRLGRRRRHRRGAQAGCRAQVQARSAGGCWSREPAIFAGLTATGIVADGVRTALGDPVLKRVQIPLAKLPRDHGRLPDRARQRHPPRPADRHRAHPPDRARHQRDATPT